jgi:hypothetical protein
MIGSSSRTWRKLLDKGWRAMSTTGSRLLSPDEEANHDADVRLITIDRPGYSLDRPRLSGLAPD